MSEATENPLPPQEPPVEPPSNQPLEDSPSPGLLDRVKQQLDQNSEEPKRVTGTRMDEPTRAKLRAEALKAGRSYEEVDAEFGPVGNKATIQKVERSNQTGPSVIRHSKHPKGELPYQNLGTWHGKETHIDPLRAKPIPPSPSGRMDVPQKPRRP